MENQEKTLIEQRQEIITKIKATADRNGYGLTENLDRIANAKLNFFGCQKWALCPCDPGSDRACISKHCREDIAKDGVCHCNLYLKAA